MSQSNKELAQARRRIDIAILHEIVLSYATADFRFFEDIDNFDEETAKILHDLSTGTTSRLASYIRGGIFKISVDSDALKRSLSAISKDVFRDLQMEQLLDLGTNKKMLAQLGFSATTYSDKWLGGRPPILTDKQLVLCEEFWATWKNPHHTDPLDILIATSRYLNIMPIVLWQHLGPGNVSNSADLKQYTFSTPTHLRPWVRRMFRDWPVPNN